MSTQHTPGPWKAHHFPHGSGLTVVTNPPKGERDLFVGQVIASKTTCPDWPANARLIASAPDLLEELETAVARVALANSEGNSILSAWLPGALNAIARAKGGE